MSADLAEQLAGLVAASRRGAAVELYQTKAVGIPADVVGATGMTWPNGALVPPFVRIDHVLTGLRLTVTQIATGPGSGSDHRYLLATIAIQRG